jgi:hypothetical protein
MTESTNAKFLFVLQYLPSPVTDALSLQYQVTVRAMCVCPCPLTNQEKCEFTDVDQLKG